MLRQVFLRAATELSAFRVACDFFSENYQWCFSG